MTEFPTVVIMFGPVALLLVGGAIALVHALRSAK